MSYLFPSCLSQVRCLTGWMVDDWSTISVVIGPERFLCGSCCGTEETCRTFWKHAASQGCCYYKHPFSHVTTLSARKMRFNLKSGFFASWESWTQLENSVDSRLVLILSYVLMLTSLWMNIVALFYRIKLDDSLLFNFIFKVLSFFWGARFLKKHRIYNDENRSQEFHYFYTSIYLLI